MHVWMYIAYGRVKCGCMVSSCRWIMELRYTKRQQNKSGSL